MFCVWCCPSVLCVKVTDREDAVELKNPATGGISFQDVHFGYGPDRQILKGLTFEVRTIPKEGGGGGLRSAETRRNPGLLRLTASASENGCSRVFVYFERFVWWGVFFSGSDLSSQSNP